MIELALSLFVIASAGSIIGILGVFGVSESVEVELVGVAVTVAWMTVPVIVLVALRKEPVPDDQQA